MPKILILFAGQPNAMTNAVAEGARSVRFSEVELRRISARPAGTPSDHHQTLAGLEEMVPYDGIIVAASASGAMPPELSAVFEQAAAAAPGKAWQNKVGSAFTPNSDGRPDVWRTLATLGDLGMIVIAPSASGEDAGRELGARVAQAVGWVTHARSHHHHAH